MGAAAVIFFLAGVFLLGGMLYNMALYKKPGMYPPKRVIKKRASILASGLGIFVIFCLLIIFLK
ncbi:hypothetical protein BN1002_04593 [Bacillus sp. B-jedd]|nr:hypothetical protein BN1002_04593 [Bacillus sp. B-jedd]